MRSVHASQKVYRTHTLDESMDVTGLYIRFCKCHDEFAYGNCISVSNGCERRVESDHVTPCYADLGCERAKLFPTFGILQFCSALTKEQLLAPVLLHGIYLRDRE
jgi:hypothetical protein